MGLFDWFVKKKEAISFEEIDSQEKAIELARKGVLKPLYLMPLRFNGPESPENAVFVPPVAVELKDRFDDMVEELFLQGKVNGYSGSPEYKGRSFVPSRVHIVAKKDGEPVFTETIEIW